MKYLNKTILEISNLIKSGEAKAADVVAESMSQIEKHNKKINAFVAPAEGALQKAEEIDKKIKLKTPIGILAGVPIGIKDMFCTRGIKTTACSKILNNFIPPYSATVVERIENADAVVMGKLNCDEFAMGSSNEHSIYGAVENPWKEKYVPGGSSGGSGAAVAARMVLGATGTDTGGSIRQPSSFCGIVGMKPTYGRVSRYGIVAFASSLDQAGPMATTVKDTALMLQAFAGFDERDSTTSSEKVPDWVNQISSHMKNITLGIPKEYYTDRLNPAIRKTVENAVQVLKSLGAKIVEISLPHTKYAIPVYYLTCASEASSNLARYDGIRFGLRNPSIDIDDLYKNTRGEGFGKEVKRRIMLGTFALSSGYYDAYFNKAAQVRRILLQDFKKVFAVCDAIVCPVTPGPPFKINERIEDPVTMYYNDIFTTSANLTGLPAMSVPGGFTPEGLPIGVQLIGDHFKEQTLFNIGQALEENLKLEKRIPDGF